MTTETPKWHWNEREGAEDCICCCTDGRHDTRPLEPADLNALETRVARAEAKAELADEADRAWMAGNDERPILRTLHRGILALDQGAQEARGMSKTIYAMYDRLQAELETTEQARAAAQQAQRDAEAERDESDAELDDALREIDELKSGEWVEHLARWHENHIREIWEPIADSYKVCYEVEKRARDAAEADLQRAREALENIGNWPRRWDGSMAEADASSMRAMARAALEATQPREGRRDEE